MYERTAVCVAEWLSAMNQCTSKLFAYIENITKNSARSAGNARGFCGKREKFFSTWAERSYRAKCEEREEEGIRNDNDKVVRGVIKCRFI